MSRHNSLICPDICNFQKLFQDFIVYFSMKPCLNNIVPYLNEYFLLSTGIKLSASENIKATVWLKIQLLLRQNSPYYLFSSSYGCISYHRIHVNIDANGLIYPARSGYIRTTQSIECRATKHRMAKVHENQEISIWGQC